MTALHRFSISSGLAFGILALATTGCTNGSSHSPTKHHDSARLEKVISPQEQHRKAMQADLEGTLYNAFRASARENSSNNSTKALSLADAVAWTAAKATAARMVNSQEAECKFDLMTSNISNWTKCIIKQTLAEDLSSATGLQSLVRQALKDKGAAIVGDLAELKRLVKKASKDELASIVSVLSRVDIIEKVTASLDDKLDAIFDVVSILRNGSALSDLPWLARSFFDGRSFVLTNTLQQESIGTTRVFNLDSVQVRFELNAGRMFVIRGKEGAYDGTNGEDMIVTSYPVRATRLVGNERYYQVDFSAPDNKRFLIPHVAGYDAGPDVDITAESIKVRINHANKSPKAELASNEAPSSGLYFDANDPNLVLDELILVNTTEDDTSPDEETEPGDFGKEHLRPTIRFSQGFFALNSDNDEFDKYQVRDIKITSSSLYQSVEDNTKGRDEPYFTAQTYAPAGSRFDRNYEKNARKYNLKKDLLFVISANTPIVAIPAVKSAVKSYANLFRKMAPANQPALKIDVVTQKEFEDSNRTEGLKLGGSVNAADPRVNMIQWDDNAGLGAAWATASANPRTGEVISADVMLSGATWAHVGCTDFILRKWAAKPKPGEKPVPFPPAATYFLYNEVCKMNLIAMKLVGTPEHTNGTGSSNPAASVSMETVLRLTEQGDAQGLNDEVAKLLRTELPSDSSNALARRAGETEDQYSARLDATSRQVRETFRASVPDSIPDSLSELQKIADGSKAVNAEETLPQFKFSLGKNLVNAKPDCVLHAVAGRNSIISNSGMPGVTSEFIKDGKQAALAMIRIVLVHELGHTFGLRHNFVASTTPAELEEGVEVPVAVTKRTDSIMDYNDSGVELDMGAMKDYTDAESGTDSPSFGIYDVIALANLYDLDASAIKFKTKPKFCTDKNRNLLADCLPFDFGRSSLEHMIYQMNLAVQELRMARDIDLQYGSVSGSLLNRYLGRINLTGALLQNLWSVWGALEQMAANTSDREEQLTYLQIIDQIFYAKGLTQEFFSDENYLNKAGMAPVGIWDLLNLTSEKMTFDPAKPQFLTSILATELKRVAVMAYVRTAKSINEAGAEQNPDSAYLKGISNITSISDPQSKSYMFRNILADFFSRKIVMPAGEIATQWSAIIDGAKVPKNTVVDASGNPMNIVLKAPLFNHQLQSLIIRDMTFGDGNGGTKSGIAFVRGEHELKDMVVSLLAQSQLAPWGGASGGSDVFERMKRERAQLAEMLTLGTISNNARDQARYILSVYDEVLANAFKPL